MKKYLGMIITIVVVLTLVVLSLVLSPFKLTEAQQSALIVDAIICGCSMLYCFAVGEITRNNSQMDKLWSLLPIAYTWVIAGYAEFNARTTIIAIMVTLWGIRLTFNFARKGAYQLKFWAGEEDYRWKVLRQNKYLSNRIAWGAFDLGFISIYQNALVLAICLPALMCIDKGQLPTALGVWDYLGIALAFFFLLIETIADEQQMAFHTTKNKMLKEGKTLEELPLPFSRGFNTTGLWAYSRHPNYLGEQGFWLSLILFPIAMECSPNIFHFSMIGAFLLVLLFLGSSSFQEGVSSSKYPEYGLYLAHVSKYIPFKKYRPESN